MVDGFGPGSIPGQFGAVALGSAPKKTLVTKFGLVTVAHQHVMNQAPAGFRISAYLQELALQVGQEFPFQQASDWLDTLAGVQLGAKQIERLAHYYGQQLETHPAPELAQEPTLHYCMMDGGMVMTRPNQWREMKVGRIIKATDIEVLTQKRKQVNHSVYVAHLGDCDTFFEKFTRHSDGLTSKVFLADGAQWIWDKVSERYPRSVQILDFYHCWEKFCGFAALHFVDPSQRSAWLDRQRCHLLEDQLGSVVANLLAEQVPLLERTTESQVKLTQLLTYVLNNLERMRYGSFRKMGYWIGSGAMEAAHRTLVQHRLKRSGQRWTPMGAQQVVNLRVAFQSGQWQHVQQLIQTP
jgi:hypothetical protein